MSTQFNPFGPGRNVDLKVYVYRRPHMRDQDLEFELHMGTSVLRGIFDEMKMMPEVTSVYFSFPENWLNIIEQRVLYQRLGHYCPNLTSVVIKTQSVYIIQCTPNGSCLIVNSDHEQQFGLSQETNPDGSINLTGKLYSPMVGNQFDISKLNVVR